MIDELLIKTNHIGKDGFIWWIGQVADQKYWKQESLVKNYTDPKKAEFTWTERCKVRIIGYHTFNKKELEDKDLPIAHIMMSTTFGSGQGGLGATSNLSGGEICFGFFLDGDDAQQPVIVGLLNRPRQVINQLPNDDFAFQPFTGYSNEIPPTKRKKAEPGQIGGASNKVEPKPSPISNGTDNPLIWNAGWGTTTTSNNFQSSNLITPGSDLNVNLCYNVEGIVSHKEAFTIDYLTKRNTFTYVPPSVCGDNFIGKITQILKDFIGFINTIQKYKNTYIDPVLNQIVDIKSEIESVASSIGGIIRLIVNSMRGALIKCVTSLFKNFFNIQKQPFKTILSESFKNILNIIYCLFEKLMPRLLNFIEKQLGNMFDKVFSAPTCAINEWISGILAHTMNSIDELLSPVISGVNWLTGGLSSVFKVLNRVSSVATQIYDFIGCDNMKCTQPSKWVVGLGPSKMSSDNWSKMVKSIDYVRGTSDDLGGIESAIAGFSLYNSSSNSSCSKRVNNPRTQDDLPTLYPGYRYYKCIPPVIEVFGDGYGASLHPIIDSQGRIIAVDILSPGFDYSSAPSLTVIDNSGYGSGAQLKSKIDSNGSISDVIVLNTGSGYCPGKPQIGIGTNQGDDIGTDITVYITSSKDRIFEGDSVIFTVNSTDTEVPAEVEYELSGINSQYIQQPLTDTLTLQNGIVDFEVKTLVDESISAKELRFEIKKYNVSKSIIVEDVTQNSENRDNEYFLTADNYAINEGTPFTIRLNTINLEDGTIVPFTITGVNSKLIENFSSYKEFEVYDNQAEIKFRTNKGVIDQNQIFNLKLDNDKASVGILINKIEVTEDTVPTLCLTGIELIRPGIGYNLNDTATDGVNTYELIISPDNGAVFGAISLANPICGYNSPPAIIINSVTGVGAELVPIMKIDRNITNNLAGISTTALKIVDCI